MIAMRLVLPLLAAVLIAVCGAARAAGGAEIRMEPSPINRLSLESQQRGARTFVNYCLNCHSAKYMRRIDQPKRRGWLARFRSPQRESRLPFVALVIAAVVLAVAGAM